MKISSYAREVPELRSDSTPSPSWLPMMSVIRRRTPLSFSISTVRTLAAFFPLDFFFALGVR